MIGVLLAEHALKTARTIDFFICIRWINSAELYTKYNAQMPLSRAQRLEHEVAADNGDKARFYELLGEKYYKAMTAKPRL